MFIKIQADMLRVGMYVVDVESPLLKHDLLFSLKGHLHTENEIELIHKSGFLEAYIDLNKSMPGSVPAELIPLDFLALEGEENKDYTPPPPTVPLAEEMQKARTIYSSSISFARTMFDGLQSGDFTPELALPVVDDILDSLDRNSSALFGLCKLRQTDEYTYTHCVNVSVLAVTFARGLGVPQQIQRQIGLGGLFHDLGKRFVPTAILNAPRKLTQAEFDLMKKHPLYGKKILDNIPNIPEATIQAVVEHHEKADGSGYPFGLNQGQLSLVGKISCIVDIFDALSSKRVYKDAMPLHKVLSILYSMRESAFQPHLLDRFINLIGVFPLGSAVQLKDGRRGVVSGLNHNDSLRPKVILVQNEKKAPVPREEIDLANEQSCIAKAISSTELGVDPVRVLGIPTGSK